MDGEQDLKKKNHWTKKQKKEKRRQAYDRVYAIHEQADFLCYINDAYLEFYQGQNYRKLEGVVAKGKGTAEDIFELFDCEGRKKADVTMVELYLGNNCVEQLEGGDKRVALYPNEQDIAYQAGDILCIRKHHKSL